MKKIICIIICLLVLSSTPVFADEYTENFSDFGIDKTEQAIDNETKEILDNNGLDLKDKNWVNNLSVKGVFNFLLNTVKDLFKTPFIACLSVLGITLTVSAAKTFFDEKILFDMSYACAAAAALAISVPIWKSITFSVDAVKSVSTFMISFVPTFTGLCAASGLTLSAAAASGVLLILCTAVSNFAAFGVMPLMGGYLCISVTGGISPLIQKSGLADTLKKVTLWTLTLISTVFLGVLSVQTAVNSAADSALLKTAKFILGTGVPVAGNILSEAVVSVASSVGFLRSSVGIYAVIVVAVIMIPVILNILIWRICLTVCAGFCNLFCESKTEHLLKSVDSTAACLLGILLLTFALFIISLGILTTAGKGL